MFLNFSPCIRSVNFFLNRYLFNSNVLFSFRIGAKGRGQGVDGQGEEGW